MLISLIVVPEPQNRSPFLCLREILEFIIPLFGKLGGLLLLAHKMHELILKLLFCIIRVCWKFTYPHHFNDISLYWVRPRSSSLYNIHLCRFTSCATSHRCGLSEHNSILRHSLEKIYKWPTYDRFGLDRILGIYNNGSRASLNYIILCVWIFRVVD